MGKEQLELHINDAEFQKKSGEIRVSLEKSRRWLTTILLFTALFPVLTYLFYYNQARREMTGEFFRYVEATTRMIATQIDPRRHALLVAEGSDVDDPLYLELLDNLVDLHYSNPDIHYLVTMVQRDGQSYIVLDTANVLPEDRRGNVLTASVFMEPYGTTEGEDMLVFEAAERGESFVYDEPYTDEFGTFIGACAPIPAIPDGEVVVTCIDVDDTVFRDRISALRNDYLGVSVLAALFCLMLFYAILQMHRRMQASFTLLQQQRDTYLQSAHSDVLTGALNRRSLELAFASALSRLQRQGTLFALVAIDVDHFKDINDAHGHDIGDKALVAMVEHLQTKLRRGDWLARIGGEEFIVLTEPTNEAGIMTLAEKLRTEVESIQVTSADGEPIPMTISLGIYVVQPKDSMESALKAADIALYKAKETGRNRWVMFEGTKTGKA